MEIFPFALLVQAAAAGWSTDFEASLAKARERKAVLCVALVGDTAPLSREFRVVSLPTTILLDRAGNQTRRIANPANEAVLRLFIRGLLREG